MKLARRAMIGVTALVLAAAAPAYMGIMPSASVPANAAEDISSSMEWGSVKIGGGGFVSAVVAGDNNMYARTDVGGAYRYDYKTQSWVQLLDFINDSDRGMLSVSGIALDPTDDNTAYFLCGCAYFSDARTAIYKTTDGGETFSVVDVTDLIQVHANGDGRECSEPIAVDPDNPNTIYCGGDVTAGESCLIKSTDGGKTWKPVLGYDKLGFFTNEIKWPTWTDHIARGTGKGEYNTQNGVDVVKVIGGKVYVGTSVTGTANIHVADVKTDEFSVLSKDLPTANYPLSITDDGNGNLFFTYIAGLAFGGAAGGAYKYNIASGKVTDISPAGNAIGTIYASKDDPNKLVTRTCGVWSSQYWAEEWSDDTIAWGDWFYRSEDGGATWENITPGAKEGAYTPDEHFVSLPLQTGGYDWVYGKACHWGSSLVIDPHDPDKIVTTSGNGMFACDNVWDERDVQFYFHPDGIEEVVALDFVSVKGGSNFSAIGDYDGYEHTDVNEIGRQYKPNMGSTSAIAACPQNPKVMVRVSEGDAGAYYSTDGGVEWTKLGGSRKSGKAAITELSSGKYRIFHSDADGKVAYTDDFGGTWTNVASINPSYGSKPTFVYVEPEKPEMVYAYVTNYNSSWGYSKTEPDFSDAHYTLYVSSDYGKTFTGTDVCEYDMCDSAGRIAALGEGDLILGGGWYGLYNAKINADGSADITDLNVFYCKTVGYGAPEKSGGLNTLFMYGKPESSDPEGIYRSTDGGKSWVCINTEHLYGGTGNGNFLVGDMNEFGTVYMSTVGCGIVYGKIGSESDPTTKPTGTTGDVDDILYGDADCDGDVAINDAILILQSLANPSKYSVTSQGKINGDCCNPGGGLDAEDALAIQKKCADLVALPIK